MAVPDADALIQALGLTPHPEGGHYRETWRTSTLVGTDHGPRPAGTAILFLLAAGQCSRWHRIRSDEVWLHQGGGPLIIHELCASSGVLQQTRLGLNLPAGETPQHGVMAGRWFAAEPLQTDGWSLVGCSVAPGFCFEDFELATAADLEPHHRVLDRHCPGWRGLCHGSDSEPPLAPSAQSQA
ncbi:MAG: hypothetical protein RLZZ124_1421 [Cyanobacteriota bacterium]|jgi:predicted cupin superfamily sugar epimerase